MDLLLKEGKGMKKNILEKLTSRKFIVTVITAIAGIITAIIGENETVQIIVGAAMTIIPTIVYCITEGVLDAKSVKVITEATAEAAEKLGADEKVVDVIEQAGGLGETILKDKTE
jgi:hypothetical protein